LKLLKKGGNELYIYAENWMSFGIGYTQKLIPDVIPNAAAESLLCWTIMWTSWWCRIRGQWHCDCNCLGLCWKSGEMAVFGFFCWEEPGFLYLRLNNKKREMEDVSSVKICM
jgi:hypothetical protein